MHFIDEVRMKTLLAVCTLVVAATLVSEAQVGRRQDVFDANTATDKELQTVPNITPALVSAIVEKRPFGSVKELDAALAALSAQQKAEVYRKVFVAINLNTAPRE